ncbi:MAG: radical SAM protein [Planctomycetes bacterium]|nr:radical SAM protein [Planctomycetota bacterium]
MYLRVSVTDRCNLRCTYCLPEDARFSDSRAAPEEIDALMGAVCAAVPVSKIRLTGGEPTLSPDLERHVRAAAWLVPTVGLTSNGVLLEQRLADLRDAGLNRLNISLDAADPAGFQRATRRDRFAAVLGSIRQARKLGFDPLKINAVAMSGIDPTALARLAVAEGVHLRFIELMDIGEAHNGWESRHVGAATIQERLRSDGLRIHEAPECDEPTSRVWHIEGVDPHRTTLGFITTVSAPFCSTCDRIRLDSRGRLHTCLFDEAGVDLLSWLRAGDEHGLVELIRRTVAGKAPPPRFRREGAMAAIGG